VGFLSETPSLSVDVFFLYKSVLSCTLSLCLCGVGCHLRYIFGSWVNFKVNLSSLTCLYVVSLRGVLENML